jgi:hypothetical protein
MISNLTLESVQSIAYALSFPNVSFSPLIPQVMDGYCNIRKIPDNYWSMVEHRVTKNYSGCILRRCSDNGLTQDKERRFTPKPCDFEYADKNHPESGKETEQHSTNGFLSHQSSDSIYSDDTSTKTISADNTVIDTEDGAIINTGHAAEHVTKEASDNFNAIQKANVSFNLV